MAQKPTYEKLEKRIVELEIKVSDLKLAEEELAAEKKRLTSLIEHSSLAIVTLDAQHNIVSCNRFFENLLGAALLRRSLLTVSGSLYCFIVAHFTYLITFR